MKKDRDQKSPDSVLHRLRNRRVEGQSAQNAQVLFVLERFLARVAASPYRDRLVLKGGILLYLLMGLWTRPTEDLDFLAMRIPSEDLQEVLAEVLALDLEDRLEFQPGSMSWEDIREDSGYPCRRFTIPYKFGAKHTHRIKLDMSFGDPVSPRPEYVELRPILEGFQGGTILGYPIETVLAEKLETLLARGLANTRAKDLFDLWVLSKTCLGLRMNPVAMALTTTSDYRGTMLRTDYEALLPSYASDARLKRIWDSYRTSKGLVAPEFEIVVQLVQGFVRPMVEAALGGAKEGSWDPSVQRWI